MNDLVRVKLENGMEASLPRDHAINSGYEPLIDENGAPVLAADNLGNALEATGAAEALAARNAKSEGDQEPPRSGQGSGLEAWQNFARTQGATDDDLADKSRDDLVVAYGADSQEG